MSESENSLKWAQCNELLNMVRVRVNELVRFGTRSEDKYRPLVPRDANPYRATSEMHSEGG